MSRDGWDGGTWIEGKEKGQEEGLAKALLLLKWLGMGENTTA